MNQDQCIDLALPNQVRAHHRFPESGGGRQNADVIGQKCLSCRHLLWAELPTKRDADLMPGLTVILHNVWSIVCVKQIH